MCMESARRAGNIENNLAINVVDQEFLRYALAIHDVQTRENIGMIHYPLLSQRKHWRDHTICVVEFSPLSLAFSTSSVQVSEKTQAGS